MAEGGCITTMGKNVMLNRTYKSTPDYSAPTVFQVGLGTTTPAVTDTAIEIPIPITGTEAVDDCDAITGWTASGTNSVAATTTFYKEGDGALTLVKSDASSATCSVSKTTTSVDYTSKTLWMFTYISASLYAKLEATGTALQIRFGSDSSNYYYKNYLKADLVAGWNYHYFSSATATGTTSSPTITACDYTYVAVITANATDTSSTDDFIFDDIKVASVDDYKKIYVTGYPTFDEVNKKVTVRCHLTTLDAVGFGITELGTFNTDTSPAIIDHDVFTLQSKTDFDEFVFVIENDME